MLDLKAKLAAAGLVTAADVAAAERKERPPRGQDRRPDARDARDNRGPDNRGPDNRGPDSRGNNSNPGNRGPDNRGSSNPGNRGNDNRGPNRGNDNRGPGNRGPGHANRGSERPAASKPGLDVVALKRAGKGESYDAIRRAVDRTRLDPVRAIPGEDATAFHFMTASGQLSRLMLDPDIHTQLADGTAAIVAFMSHHGLAHCVVARPLAEAIAEVFPLWLRVLKDHPGAGQLEPPRPPPEPTATPTSEPTADAPDDSSLSNASPPDASASTPHESSASPDASSASPDASSDPPAASASGEPSDPPA